MTALEAATQPNIGSIKGTIDDFIAVMASSTPKPNSYNTGEATSGQRESAKRRIRIFTNSEGPDHAQEKRAVYSFLTDYFGGNHEEETD